MPDETFFTVDLGEDEHEQWKIVWADRLLQDGQECFGLCDYANKTVTLSRGQNADELLDTVLHEALHGAEKGLGILSEAWIRKETRVAVAMLKAVFKIKPKNGVGNG